MTKDITIHELDYHRNGISGEGFYACRFTSDIEGTPTEFIATVFPPDPNEDGEPDWGLYERGDWDNPRVAVFAVEKLPDVRFFHNSWRGDNFAPALYKAIVAERDA